MKNLYIGVIIGCLVLIVLVSIYYWYSSSNNDVLMSSGNGYNYIFGGAATEAQPPVTQLVYDNIGPFSYDSVLSVNNNDYVMSAQYTNVDNSVTNTDFVSSFVLPKNTKVRVTVKKSQLFSNSQKRNYSNNYKNLIKVNKVKTNNKVNQNTTQQK